MADRAVGELLAVPTPPPRGGSFSERAAPASISRSNSCGSSGSIARSLSFTRRRNFAAGMSLEDARDVLDGANYAGSALRFAAAQQLLAEHFPIADGAEDVEPPPPLSMPENTRKPSSDLKDIGPMPERKPGVAFIKVAPPRPKTPPPPPPTEDARYGAFNIAAPAVATEPKKDDTDHEEEAQIPVAGAKNAALRRFRMNKSSSKKQINTVDNDADPNVEMSRNRSFRRVLSGSSSKKTAADSNTKNISLEKLEQPPVDDKPTQSIVPNRSSRRNLMARSSSKKNESKSTETIKESKSSSGIAPSSSRRIRMPRTSSKKRVVKAETDENDPTDEEKSSPGMVRNRSSRRRMPRVSSKKRVDQSESAVDKDEQRASRGPPEDKAAPGIGESIAVRRKRMPRSPSKKRPEESDRQESSDNEHPEDKQTPGIVRNRSIRRFMRSPSKKRVNSTQGTTPTVDEVEDLPSAGLARSRSMMRHLRLSLSSSKKNLAVKDPVTTEKPEPKSEAEPVEPEQPRSVLKKPPANTDADEDSGIVKRMDSKRPAPATTTPRESKKRIVEKGRSMVEQAEANSSQRIERDQSSKRRFRIVSKRRSASVDPPPEAAPPVRSKHVTFQDQGADENEEGREGRRTLPPDAERPNIGPRVHRVRNLLTALRIRTKFSKNATNMRNTKADAETVERRDSTDEAENKKQNVQPLRRVLSEKKGRMVVKSQKPAEKSPDGTDAVGSVPEEEPEVIPGMEDEKPVTPRKSKGELQVKSKQTSSVPSQIEKPSKSKTAVKSKESVSAKSERRKEKLTKTSTSPTEPETKKTVIPEKSEPVTKPITTEAVKDKIGTETTVVKQSKVEDETEVKPGIAKPAKTEAVSKSVAVKSVNNEITTKDRGTRAIGNAPVPTSSMPVRSPSDKFLKAKAVFATKSEFTEAEQVAQSASMPSVLQKLKETTKMPRTSSDKGPKDRNSLPRTSSGADRKESKSMPRILSGSKSNEKKPLPRTSAGTKKNEKESLSRTSSSGERKEANPMPRTSSGTKRKSAKILPRSSSGSKLEDMKPASEIVSAENEQPSNSVAKILEAEKKSPSPPRSSSSGKHSVGLPAALLASVEPEPMRKMPSSEEDIGENTRKVHVRNDVRKVRMPGTGKELVVSELPVESAGVRIRRKKGKTKKTRLLANRPRVDLTI